MQYRVQMTILGGTYYTEWFDSLAEAKEFFARVESTDIGAVLIENSDYVQVLPVSRDWLDDVERFGSSAAFFAVTGDDEDYTDFSLTPGQVTGIFTWLAEHPDA